MTSYFAITIVLAVLATCFGWQIGRRCDSEIHPPAPFAAGMGIGFGLLWFIAAWLARSYADTDGFGSALAERFAHSGKWLVLLIAAGLGNGFICGTNQLPTTFWRKIFYIAAVSSLVALVFVRTVPIYFLLGDGRRDANGLLRQSETIESTCAAVAMLNFLEQFQHHPPLSEREVSRICGVTVEGTTTGALVRAAHEFGLTNATARVLTLAEIQKAKLPAIVCISTLPTVHHASLLVKLDDASADFIDPAYGKWTVPRSRFQEIWYGKTVLLEP